MNVPKRRFFKPDLLLVNGRFERGRGLLVDGEGRVCAATEEARSEGAEVVELPGKAMLPGFVNAHSHTFQRLIRGHSEHLGSNGDDFWSWRQAMYRAALAVSEDDVYDVARMAFLEMVLAGTTAVGEFHYVHRAPDGSAYDDPNLLGKRVIAAAQSVGIRITLLRVAYMRAGFELPANPGQLRFYEGLDEYLGNLARMERELAGGDARVLLGAAPHSIRAVPLAALAEIVTWAGERERPLHLHAAEQPAEIEACLREYGKPPVSLLAGNDLLSQRTTLVHSIHVTEEELSAIAEADATICSCPTTERNLGDGIMDARRAIERGVRFAFGSDSQTQIDPLEDARELEYHLRLRDRKRVLLDGLHGEGIAERLFGYATRGGGQAIGVEAGCLGEGEWADFFTVDLREPSIAGSPDAELLSTLVFSGGRGAIRDVCVAGDWILREGIHPLQAEIVDRYAEVSRRVWIG